jgi:hypothetical protein
MRKYTEYLLEKHYRHPMPRANIDTLYTSWRVESLVWRSGTGVANQ